MLSCSHCHSDRPFEQSKGWNPRKVNISKNVDHKYTPSEVSVNSASSTNEKTERYNVFGPHYSFGTECLDNIDQSNFQNLSWAIYAVTDEPDEMKSYTEKQVAAKAKDSEATIEKTDNEQLQLFDTKKYRNILGKSYTDYTLALALYSDGVGAGSFVYLRRILEHFVEEVHTNCVNQCNEAVSNGSGSEFNEEEY